MSGVGAGRHQPSVATETLEGLWKQLGVADVFEHYVDALAAGDLACSRGEIFAAIVDAELRPEFHRQRHVTLGSGRRDHGGADLPRHLDAHAGETAARAHHEDV